MKSLIKILPAAALLMLCGCQKGGNGWQVEGNVDGAAGQKLALEQNVGGNWVLLDSLDIDAAGHFSYRADSAASYPDLYRLSYADRQLYFPIDSLDHITVSTKANDFGGRYKMSGSQSAMSINAADSLIYSYIDRMGLNQALADSTLKVQLFELFRQSDDVMTPYYLIYRHFGGQPLYDIVSRPLDFKMLGAVANKFKTQRPDDPRSKFLENVYLSARKQRGGGAAAQSGQAVEATLSTDGGDIVSVDINGKQQALYNYIGKGKPVLLSFAAYSAEGNPAYTMALRGVYDKYKGQGLQIYQVAVDESEAAWRQTANTLPWVSVWLNAVKGNDPTVSYNVQAVPMTYLFDAQGTLVKRIIDPAQIEAAVAGVM